MYLKKSNQNTKQSYQNIGEWWALHTDMYLQPMGVVGGGGGNKILDKKENYRVNKVWNIGQGTNMLDL